MKKVRLKQILSEILTEAPTLTPQKMVSILRSNDFGMTEAGGNGEAVLSGETIIIRDSFYYGEQRALNGLVKSWSPGGTQYEYFKKEYGIELKIINKDSWLVGGKMYGKKQRNGVVEIHLKII